MNRLHTSVALAALSLAFAAAPLVASGPARGATARPPVMAPAEVVRTRIAGLKEMGTAFKNAMDGLRSSEPQTILIQQSARTIKNDSVALRGWFPAGSGPQPGLKTAAKPEIWTKPVEFRAAQDQLARAADAFQAAAAGGNVDAMRAAARSLGGSCKNCHDQFRVPDQH
ncbi:MAG: cytochrome c [Novosphingobium sp.]